MANRLALRATRDVRVQRGAPPRRGTGAVRGVCLIAVLTLAPNHGVHAAMSSRGYGVTPSRHVAASVRGRTRIQSHVVARTGANTATDTATVTPAMVEAGRKIFHGKGGCLMCHGPHLEGTAMAPTLKEHAWKDAKGGGLEAILGVVTHGVPGTVMISHPGGISEEEAAEVAGYVWAVSHGHAQP